MNGCLLSKEDYQCNRNGQERNDEFEKYLRKMMRSLLVRRVIFINTFVDTNYITSAIDNITALIRSRTPSCRADVETLKIIKIQIYLRLIRRYQRKTRSRWTKKECYYTFLMIIALILPEMVISWNSLHILIWHSCSWQSSYIHTI